MKAKKNLSALSLHLRGARGETFGGRRGVDRGTAGEREAMKNKAQSELERPKLKDSGAVIHALRRFFDPACYAFVEQVANGTGFSVRGWADAVAIGLWPSRGLDICGIEVKVSRQDWKAELKDGGKAENIARFCDCWYLAVGDETIVHEGELPSTWGLLVPSKDGLRLAVSPTRNPEVEISRGFIAAVLRRVAKPDANALAEEYRRGENDARKKYRPTPEQAVVASQLQDYERLKKVCEQFEQASGINLLHAWDGKKIGEAVRVLSHGNITAHLRQLEHIASQAENLHTLSKKSLEALRAGVTPC